MLTVSELEKALPSQLKRAATQALADKINQISGDPDFAEMVRNNFLSYTSVLKEGRFKAEDYLNAVTYVSFKLMGFNNTEAYRRTFPDRATRLDLMGLSDKEVSAYVSAYNNNKLVNLIMEQTLVPTWVLNADIYQAAINRQAYLMMHAASEKVQTDAANSLLTHLKKPEVKQMEVSLTNEEPQGMKELKDMLSFMAQRQQELIGQGVPTKTIAHQRLGSQLAIEETHAPAYSSGNHTTPHQTAPIDGTAKDVTPE